MAKNETEEQRFAALCKALLTLKSEDEVKRFLTDLCTPGEMKDFGERFLIARLLHKGGHSYREISAMTGASTTTVGRVARFLEQEPHQGYKAVLERVNVMPSVASDMMDGTYLVLPDVTPAPAIIVIQEIFGVNADMRANAMRLPLKVISPFAPDLFWRQEPGVHLTDKSKAEWDKAFALLQGFDIAKGVEDLDAVLTHLRKMPECTGRVGGVGYCLGGKLAYLMAVKTDINVSIGYYGVGLDGLLSGASQIKNPMMLHIAELDKFSTPKPPQNRGGVCWQ